MPPTPKQGQGARQRAMGSMDCLYIYILLNGGELLDNLALKCVSQSFMEFIGGKSNRMNERRYLGET